MMKLNTLKEQAWFKPFLPVLRRLRLKTQKLKQYPAFRQEQKRSSEWSKKQNALRHAYIEGALRTVKAEGGFFGSWAVSEFALLAFTQFVFSETEHPTILEFGSGQSTRFWNHFCELEPLNIHTFEHHPHWIEQVEVRSPNVTVHATPLVQVSEENKTAMFETPERAISIMKKYGEVLPESEWDNTRTVNAFYQVDFEALFEPKSIHGVVLDGPNGSGRSLCFPMIKSYLAPRAFILIDDYNHYPFIEELDQVFSYEMLHVSDMLGKNWCLLRLK